MPGKSPTKSSRSSQILSTWSLTSPTVNDPTLLLSGLLSKLEAISYTPFVFLLVALLVFISNISSFTNGVVKVIYAILLILLIV